MHALSKTLHKLGQALERIFHYICILLITVLVVIITIQVIFRVFFTAFSWTEEVSRFLLIYLSMVGTALAYRKGSHISIRLFHEKLSVHSGRIIDVVIHLACLVFFMLMIRFSIQLIVKQQFQVSGALQLPMQYIYMSIPISMVAMTLFSIEMLADNICKLTEGRAAQ